MDCNDIRYNNSSCHSLPFCSLGLYADKNKNFYGKKLNIGEFHKHKLNETCKDQNMNRLVKMKTIRDYCTVHWQVFSGSAVLISSWVLQLNYTWHNCLVMLIRFPVCPLICSELDDSTKSAPSSQVFFFFFGLCVYQSLCLLGLLQIGATTHLFGCLFLCVLRFQKSPTSIYFAFTVSVYAWVSVW